MKQVIIFGTRQRGAEVFAILEQMPQYNAVAFSCSNPQEWGSQKLGLEIIPPKEMASRYPDAVVVIASVHSREIERQLQRENCLPGAGCADIQDLIGYSSDEIKEHLKKNVQRETSFYDLDFKSEDFLVGGEAEYLIICNGGYPKEGNPRCMFAHERVLQYLKAGMKIEAFGLILDAPFEQYEYQGVRVFQGGVQQLKYLLQNRNYKKLLIHFVTEGAIYAIEKAGKADMPIIVWAHGSDTLSWFHFWFDYPSDVLLEKKPLLDRESRERQVFLREIYSWDNIQFIFVSSFLMECSRKFVGCLPKRCQVIHNFINQDFFSCPPKKPEDRLHILSIKSHGTRVYANDLTAKAILELSSRSWFPELTFDLYGDGVLFEENFGELLRRDFPNVHIHRKFLSHDQIKELFKDNGMFLSPTRMDTQGVIANEAMSAGLAVISCAVGAIPEFIDEKCGSLFQPENYWMMAEEIEYLYFHPEEFLEKGKNAALRIKQQCGYEETIQKELDMILGDADEHSDLWVCARGDRAEVPGGIRFGA